MDIYKSVFIFATLLGFIKGANIQLHHSPIQITKGCNLYGQPIYYGFHYMAPFLVFFSPTDNDVIIDPLIKKEFDLIIDQLNLTYEKIQQLIMKKEKMFYVILYQKLRKISSRLQLLCYKILPFSNNGKNCDLINEAFCANLTFYMANWSSFLDETFPSPVLFQNFNPIADNENNYIAMTKATVDSVNFKLESIDEFVDARVKFHLDLKNILDGLDVYEDLYECVPKRLIRTEKGIMIFYSLMGASLRSAYSYIYGFLFKLLDLPREYLTWMNDLREKKEDYNDRLFINDFEVKSILKYTKDTADLSKISSCIQYLFSSKLNLSSSNSEAIISLNTFIHEFLLSKKRYPLSIQKLLIMVMKKLIAKIECHPVITKHWSKKLVVDSRDLYKFSPMGFFFQRVQAVTKKGIFLPAIFSLYLKYFPAHYEMLTMILTKKFLSSEVAIWNIFLVKKATEFEISLSYFKLVEGLLGITFLELFNNFSISYNTCLFKEGVVLHFVNQQHTSLDEAILEFAKCLLELIDYEVEEMPECFDELIKIHKNMYEFYKKKGLVSLPNKDMFLLISLWNHYIIK